MKPGKILPNQRSYCHQLEQFYGLILKSCKLLDINHTRQEKIADIFRQFTFSALGFTCSVPAKFSADKQTRKIFCPTAAAAIQTLTESSLGRPSHIIIHVGTNDIEHSSSVSCHSQFQTLVQIASQKYPTSKVLISSLLKRSDAMDHRRSELNSKLGSICAPFPNVHLVNNENIPIDHLHDHKHLKKQKIGALVANLKDVIYNRIRPPKQSTGPINQRPIPSLIPRSPQHAKLQQPPLQHPLAQPGAHLYPTQPSYATVAGMSPPEMPP